MRENALVDGNLIHISAILTGDPNAASSIMIASVDGDRPVPVERTGTDDRSFPTTHVSPGTHQVKVWRTQKTNPTKVITESEFTAEYCVGPCPTIPHGRIEVSTESLSFNGVSGETVPAAQVVTVSNSGVAPMVFAVRTDQPFCDVRPYSGRLQVGENVTFSVFVKGTSNPGSFACNVKVMDHNADNSPRVITVRYDVSGHPDF